VLCLVIGVSSASVLHNLSFFLRASKGYAATYSPLRIPMIRLKEKFCAIFLGGLGNYYVFQ
jgi:hypothetical protein